MWSNVCDANVSNPLQRSRLRPIVSQIDTPTYRLAKHLVQTLSPLRGKTKPFIKDSYHFVKEIKHLHLADTHTTMVSFNIQSMFICLPIEDCISIITRKLKENNMSEEYAFLIKHCHTSGYLVRKDDIYIQLDGYSNGMEDFEEKALNTAPIKPRFYKRYLDDTFTILPTDKDPSRHLL